MKIAFAVLAAVASVPLAVFTGGLAMQHGLPTPGLYAWGLLHPRPRPGFLGPDLGSLLGTQVAIDSACWFVVCCLMGLIIVRVRKKNPADGMDSPHRK